MKIFKGDDTGGRLGRALTITVHTQYDLTDCIVFFNYQGITRKWEGVEDGDTLDLFFSHNETARMSIGTFKGVMFAVDQLESTAQSTMQSRLRSLRTCATATETTTSK